MIAIHVPWTGIGSGRPVQAWARTGLRRILKNKIMVEMDELQIDNDEPMGVIGDDDMV